MDTILTSVDGRTQRPSPLPFHRRMVQYLKTEEADLWHWFTTTRKRESQVEAIRLDLLKSTYRLEATEQPHLYAVVEEIKQSYGLTVPVTFYQAQNGGSMNACLAYVPGEAHIVLSGSVQTVLTQSELRALLAHELAHFIFYEEWDGEFLIATDLLRALANDAAAAPAHLESSRLFQLYSEIFADRGAYFLTQNANDAITALLRVETGLHEVSPESYLRQAEEIFSKSQPRADGLTHPETFIRARALKLWAERGETAQDEIERMIEGPLKFDHLDLLGQQKAATITRRLLSCLLSPPWFRSEAILAHARLFFDDFTDNSKAAEEQALADEVKNADGALQKYLCYVLLDFATVDRDLAEPALAAALILSRRLELDKAFMEVAMKELNLGKKQFARIERDADEIVTRSLSDFNKNQTTDHTENTDK